jgi:hypothetical protein
MVEAGGRLYFRSGRRMKASLEEGVAHGELAELRFDGLMEED